MTPRETWTLIEHRTLHEIQSQKTVAWLTAYLILSKKVPEIREWLGSPDEKIDEVAPEELAQRKADFERIEKMTRQGNG